MSSSQNIKLKIWIPTVFTILCVIVVIAARYFQISNTLRPTLIMASSGFLITGLLSDITKPSKYGHLTLIALVFCWLGDILGPKSFIAGLLMFLLAHIFFCIAFLSRKQSKTKVLSTLFIFLVLGILLFYWLYPYLLQSHLIPVMAYIFVITSMVTLAMGMKEKSLIIIIAAILFYVSDIFVARWKYVSISSVNGYICYPLYYTSCLLFAISIDKFQKIQLER